MQSQLLRCSEHERLGVALAKMHQHAVGSMLIDCDDGSTGLLTRSDLIERVILPRLDLDVPIAMVMTHPAHSLPLESSVLDAMHAMMHWRIRHLPICSGALIVGVVSEHDLLREQRNRPDRLMLSIDRADCETALIEAAKQAAAIAGQLHRQGLDAVHIARTMSLLNDALTRQAIMLVLRTQAASGLGADDWAWLALGSEGRAEQTIVTDQDNALILRDEAMIPIWLERAEKINHLLDRMGFPLCEGAVMAMNPSWCMSLDAWLHEAQAWFRHPSPKTILKAHIVLDFRWIAGSRKLVQAFEQGLSRLLTQAKGEQGLSAQTAARQAWLQTMLSDMLQRRIEPMPAEWQFRLGRILSMFDQQRWQRDLKRQGTSLIVDATRFLVLSKLSLGQWMPHGTVERLRWLRCRDVISADESAALLDAFEAMTSMRLEQQIAMSAPQLQGQAAASVLRAAPGPNRIDLLSLNSHQRWQLRRHVQSTADFRERLRLDFVV
jgi:CBS domain-containing protein